MAAEGGTYLPPVVATLIGDADSMARTLVGAKAMLEDFSKTDTTAHVGVDVVPSTALVPQLFAIKSLIQSNLSQVGDIPLRFTDVSTLFAEKAGIDAVLRSNFSEVGMIPLHFDVTPLLTGMVEAETVIDAEWREIGSSAGETAGKAAADSWIASFIARAAAGAAAMKGLGSILGFGKGGVGLGIPGLAGAPFLAGFGTIGGLAGFSIEHLLTLTLGLVGSLAEAMAGLGVIAAGTFATMAVGMGSDMIVMRSTISDTQTLYKSWTALQQAILVHGANSNQARGATALLNDQLKILGNTAGVQAELGLAKLAYTINQQFDKATSGARVQAVALLTQVLLLGQKFIPLVADAAQRNLGIINTSLMPLFAWLGGPQGMGIFTDLENKFAKDLPTSIDAFNQAIEFLLKFLDLASNYTGGFMKSLDHLFTYLNSPTGFARVKKDVSDIMAVFKVWKDFVIILTQDIFLLLSGTVGVGTSVIQTLTGMLNQLHTYLESTSGKKAIGSLFQAHKAEVLALLQLLPALVGPVSQIYLKLAVPLTQIATAIAQVVGWLLRIPGAGPIIAYGLAFQIMAGRMFGVNLALFAFQGAVKLATAALGLFDIAMDANVVGAIIIGIMILIAVIVLLVTHWKEVTKVAQQVWKEVTHWVGQLVADVGKFFSNLGSTVEKAWNQFASRPGYWIGFLIGFVAAKMIILETQIGQKLTDIVLSIAVWGINMANKAPGAVKQFSDAAIKELQKLPGQFTKIGGDMITGLINGMKNLIPWATKQIEGFFGGLAAGAMKAIQSHSPSQVFARIGETIPQGVALGVNNQTTSALTALSSMFNQMQNHGRMLAGTRGGFGTPAFAFAGGGRGAVSVNMPITVNVSGASSATPQGIGSAVQKTVHQEVDRIIQSLMGGIYSNPGMQ